MINLCKELSLDYQIFQEIRPEIENKLIEKTINNSYYLNLPLFKHKIKKQEKPDSFFFCVSNSNNKDYAKIIVYACKTPVFKESMKCLDEIPIHKKGKIRGDYGKGNKSKQAREELISRCYFITNEYFKPISEKFGMIVAEKNIRRVISAGEGEFEKKVKIYKLPAFWNTEVIRNIIEKKEKKGKKMAEILKKIFISCPPMGGVDNEFVGRAIVNINNVLDFLSYYNSEF